MVVLVRWGRFCGFAVWAYTVSHCQLLLRTGSADGPSRIDVLFKPVEAIKIRTGAVGRREDHGEFHDPSALAFFPLGTDPARILPAE